MAAVGKLTGREFGSHLLNSFGPLLRRDLSTHPVADVHQLVLGAVNTVDPTMRLYIFGSTSVYGIHDADSDVDFVALSEQSVRDGTGADATTELAKALQKDFLGKLVPALRATLRPSWSVELVSRTRVPVLRVKTGDHGVDFDVTAHRRNGVRNSALLRSYYAQQPEVRWLGLAVKQWSKASGLNASAEGGCLTSYGFNLMVAYYLLHRGLVSFVDPAGCDVASASPMPPHVPLAAPPDDGAALGSMCLDFLNFYIHEFNPEKEVITLSRPGRPTTTTSLQWTKQQEDMAQLRGEKVHYRWCIEDPFEVNLNVGRNITPFKLMMFRKHLERARDTAFLTTLKKK